MYAVAADTSTDFSITRSVSRAGETWLSAAPRTLFVSPRRARRGMRAATLVDVAALKRKLDGDEALRQRLDPRRGDIGLVRVGGRRHADGEQSRVALATPRIARLALIGTMDDRLRVPIPAKAGMSGRCPFRPLETASRAHPYRNRAAAPVNRPAAGFAARRGTLAARAGFARSAAVAPPAPGRRGIFH